MRKIILVFSFMIISFLCFAKVYHIGDIVNIKISGDTNEESIKSALKEFSDVKLQRQGEDYIVGFTSYKPGKFKVELAGAKQEFEILSLIDKNTKDITENTYDNNKKSNFENLVYWAFPVTYIVILMIILMISSLVVLIIFILKRKNRAFKQFIKDLNNAKSGDYFYLAPLAVKHYFEKRANIFTTYLTTDEFLNRISEEDINEFNNFKELKELLKDADRKKFQHENYSAEDIEKSYLGFKDFIILVERKYKELEKRGKKRW